MTWDGDGDGDVAERVLCCGHVHVADAVAVNDHDHDHVNVNVNVLNVLTFFNQAAHLHLTICSARSVRLCPSPRVACPKTPAPSTSS